MLHLAAIYAAYLFSQGEYVYLAILMGLIIAISIRRTLARRQTQLLREARREYEEWAWQEAFGHKLYLSKSRKEEVVREKERQRSWEALQARENMKRERREAHAEKVAAKAERRRAHEAREAANRQRKAAAKAEHADEPEPLLHSPPSPYSERLKGSEREERDPPHPMDHLN